MRKNTDAVARGGTSRSIDDASVMGVVVKGLRHAADEGSQPPGDERREIGETLRHNKAHGIDSIPAAEGQSRCYRR